MGLIDVHCHLLPAIDDGYVTTEQFQKMMGIYSECGFTAVAFTPHIYNPYVTTNVDSLRTTYGWAKEVASSMGITTYLGSELYVGEQETLRALPIADRYVLIEFPLSLPPARLLVRIAQLVDQGLVPIIAHVERYRWLSPQAPLLGELQRLGCLLQCNVEAVENGDANPYMEAGIVDLFATDNHGDETLAFRLANLIALWPTVGDRMDQLLQINLPEVM
ncbi:MAG: capsule biosynthesis protein CapC [Sphaerochaeta sp.]|nr:capsule biosynthesis protein CapC [Sphaerochaeta sp.]